MQQQRPVDCGDPEHAPRDATASRWLRRRRRFRGMLRARTEHALEHAAGLLGRGGRRQCAGERRILGDKQLPEHGEDRGDARVEPGHTEPTA
jgi:hypothetical protein